MADNTPQPQGVTFVPISIVGDTDPLTQDTTVNFSVSVPDGSEPELTLSFYEMHSISSSTPITVSNPPVPVWNNGVAVFSLVMDSAILSQLSSPSTNFAVAVAIADSQVRSFGSSSFAISLETLPPVGGSGS